MIRDKNGRIQKGAHLVLGAVLLVSQFVFVAPKAHAANAGDVVINEIMYNPGTGNQEHEFLELYNTTNNPISLEDWCFTAGITLVTNNPNNPACFESTAIIAAHGYFLLAASPGDAQNEYGVAGFATGASYVGSNLSNGGEILTLVDDSAQVMDTVTYDDSSPWPVSPDGDGPSLELRDPSLDNSIAAHWGASVGGATPGAQNSIYGFVDLAEISNVSKPTSVQPSSTPVITAEVDDADSVELVYRVMFETEQSTPMYDDGNHGDGAAADGVYGAQLPAQAAGQLVRYKVNATKNSLTASSPSSNDAEEYYGYAVRDSSNTSQLPILQWFIDDAVYSDLMTNHVGDNVYVKCVLVYGDEVFDNTDVRIKGEYSLSFPKKSLKFKLPGEATIQIPGKTDYPINEFHMNGEWLDETKAMTQTVWWAAKEAGIDAPVHFGTRLLRNNQYEGYYLFAEKYESEYLDHRNMSGDLYEELGEVVEPSGADPTAALYWRDSLWQPKSTTRRNQLFNTGNIPSLTNFAAFESVINSHDWGTHNNTLQYYDDTTGRWSFLPWDRDIVMNYVPQVITPYVTPSYFGADPYRAPFTNLYDEQDGRQMFFRRLRTLADTFYGQDNAFLNKYHENIALSADEAALDSQKWGSGATNQWSYEQSINRIKQGFFVRYRNAWAVPAAQNPGAVVTIGSVHDDAITPANGYIQLHNDSEDAVDISGWELDELGFVFPAGTVLAGNSSLYVPRNDQIHKTNMNGTFVAGELGQDVPQSGTLTLRRTGGSIADVRIY